MGKKVVIITNDQGDALVDAELLRSYGWPVLEVTGSCFCCNFPSFIAKLKSLIETEEPDVIIAEPGRSCTDLVATIFKPLRELYGTVVEIKPFSGSLNCAGNCFG